MASPIAGSHWHMRRPVSVCQDVFIGSISTLIMRPRASGLHWGSGFGGEGNRIQRCEALLFWSAFPRGSSMSSPVLPAPRPGRPMGLVLAAIVLTLITIVGFLSAVLALFEVLYVRPQRVTHYPLLEAIEIVTWIVVLLISGFCAWIVVGLFRMQKWSRISILVLGGVIAFFSFFSTLLYCVLAFAPPTSFVRPPSASGVTPHMIRGMLLCMAGFSLLFMLVGVSWLVYFNLRRVRALFMTSAERTQIELPASAPVAAVSAPPEIRSAHGPVEILVICLGYLYLFGAIWGIAELFVRFPLFLLGHIFRGSSAGIFGLTMAVIDVGLGVGLLRRMKAAWIAVLVFNALGLIYTLEMLSPRYQAGMSNYQLEIMRRTLSGLAPVPQPPINLAPMYIFSAIMGVLMVGAVFWLLLRARPLFERKELAN
jgi:hypothetical protein